MKKIAIVYDWLDKWGGVERVLLTLFELFPQADFFTSYYDSKKAAYARRFNIKTSFIARMPSLVKKSRFFSLPFYPLAFESFNFDQYDLVLSISSSFAKGIITKPKTKHVCYLLTPTRFLWQSQKEYLSPVVKSLFKFYIDYLRSWDVLAAQRPDKIISISETVKKRCWQIYHQKSEVIYPPFDIKYWQLQKIDRNIIIKTSQRLIKPSSTAYFLVVSRLEPYKKIELAIKAFRNLSSETLIVVGKGSLKKKLIKLATKNIIFLEDLIDQELANLYFFARALIMPQEEDFGYTALESQFFGCPIIAYQKGGVSETVINNQTGIFFQKQTVTSLIRAVERFKKIEYNLKNSTKKKGRENCFKFDKKIFIKKIKNLI